MYVALLVGLIIYGGALLNSGVQHHRRKTMLMGAAVLVLTGLFFSLMSFWGEMLWFDTLGYSRRFWTEVVAQVGLAGLGAAVGGLAVFLMTLHLPSHRWFARVWPELSGAVVGGVWGFGAWSVVLPYWQRVTTELREPIFHQDTGFYLFILPFYDALYPALFVLASLALVAAIMCIVGTQAQQNIRPGEVNDGLWFPEKYPGTVSLHQYLRLPLVVIAFVLAWGQYLNIYHLLYSTWGAVIGAGWTDVHVRLPGRLLTAVVMVMAGIVLLFSEVNHRLCSWFRRRGVPVEVALLMAIGAPWFTVLAVWIIGTGAAPALVQWLHVEPNEITLEAPYIAHNIQFTRHAFRLDQVEEREFSPTHDLTPETIANNQQLLSEVRLWDWRALEAVYQQFQAIRLYYEFPDVDVDRYQTGHAYRQVMVAARELAPDNLPPESHTFVNRRFKYTHGYGITLAPVSDFTPDGLPNLLIKDIPPRTDYAALHVERPEIYYGELTTSHVFVNTREAEFDYPRGDENVYVQQAGSGGVQLTNLWRKLLFGWKFDGTRFLLSSYPTATSRVLFHRQIRERVKLLAPFLTFDADPYIVLAEGKLYWIIDGYTTSAYYPYSTPYASTEAIEQQEGDGKRAVVRHTLAAFDGVNYIRNSVKAVVDAFNGAVTFYVFDPDDPVIQVWQKIFPDLFTAKNGMPDALLAHVRYPSDLLLAQGRVYARYHMTNPAVFYNQEDLWVRATEKYYAAVQPVEPYYVMWEPPGTDQAEFIVMLPFTPKGRQVLIGWLAGMCDASNYGRLLAYKFPKEERILGPQQVNTKIDQDRFLSGQLSLWDQHGSKVLRGNVLAIPINNSLLYVEPIYLQAETAAYPELRIVVVMHRDTLSYAATFREALQGLFSGPSRMAPTVLPPFVIPPELLVQDLIREANQAFENYVRLHAEKRFAEAGQELARLQDALQRLSEKNRE